LVERDGLRKLSWGLAFVPAVVAYVMWKPASFAGAELLRLSTSQAIGLASALAVSIAYLVFDRAAVEHPDTAMALDLPPEDLPPAVPADPGEGAAPKEELPSESGP